MKPTAPVRGIFLLTVAKILLAGAFLAVFTSRGVEAEKTRLIALTLGAYVAVALPTFLSIHHFGGRAVRALLVLALLSSIPARAYAGMALDLVALWLSFRPSARRYFAAVAAKRWSKGKLATANKQGGQLLPTGARVLVTGANGGMGVRTCQNLLDRGYHNLVLACRTETAAQQTLERLGTEFPEAKSSLVALGGFDMNSAQKTREAIAGLPPGAPFGLLFLQAGGVSYGTKRSHVEQSGHKVEATVFQNVLGGHFTLKELSERGLLAQDARIVVAGGEGARGIPGLIAKPHFDSAQALRDYVYCSGPDTPYVEMDAMGVSKFAAALWVRQLAKLAPGTLSVVWFSPGFTAGTQGLDGVGAVKQFIFENIAFPMLTAFGMAQSAEEGAEKFTRAVVGQWGASGDVLGAPEGKALGKLQSQIPMNPQIDSEALQTEFWTITEELFGKLELNAPAQATNASAAQ